MSETRTFEADREYFKAKRSQQLSNAAKIALLVTQNVQQFRSNRLLDNLKSATASTNAALKEISDTLTRVADLQRSHLELVQRERALKEILYQFERFLVDAIAMNDQLATCFGIRRILDILNHEEHSFSTVDLSDIADKRHFDAIVTRARQQLQNLPQEQLQRLIEFETLIGLYVERRNSRFDANRIFPLKPYPELPEAIADLPSWPESSSKRNNDSTVVGGGCGSTGALGCGYVLLFFGVFLALLVAGRLANSPNDADGSESKISPTLYITVAALMLFGIYMILQVYRRRSQVRSEEAARQLAEQKEASLRRQARERDRQKRKKGRMAWYREMKKVKPQIDAENERIREKQLNATKIHEAATEEMRLLINDVISRHPLIREFIGEL